MVQKVFACQRRMEEKKRQRIPANVLYRTWAILEHFIEEEKSVCIEQNQPNSVIFVAMFGNSQHLVGHPM